MERICILFSLIAPMKALFAQCGNRLYHSKVGLSIQIRIQHTKAVCLFIALL